MVNKKEAEEKKKDEEVKRLRESYLNIQNKKKKINFTIPQKLRFPISWTLFFVVVGIAQQSIISKSFVFKDFFYRNYIDWFASFGNFTEVYIVADNQNFLLMLLSHWYYFFFTGGLLSIIWAIIYLLIHMQIKVKREDYPPKST